jgi:large-conductance mechanosensitive channel
MRQNEDEIYGLIVQAKEHQKFVLEFKAAAEGVIKTLPSASRDVIENATREIIDRRVEEASTTLQTASLEAKAAATALRSAQAFNWLLSAFTLLLISFVIVAGMYFVSSHMIQNRLTEVKRLQANVDTLNRELGNAVFNVCDGRPCVRVDERAGRFGRPQDGELYMVLFNY